MKENIFTSWKGWLLFGLLAIVLCYAYGDNWFLLTLMTISIFSDILLLNSLYLIIVESQKKKEEVAIARKEWKIYLLVSLAAHIYTYSVIGNTSFEGIPLVVGVLIAGFVSKRLFKSKKETESE